MLIKLSKEKEEELIKKFTNPYNWRQIAQRISGYLILETLMIFLGALYGLYFITEDSILYQLSTLQLLTQSGKILLNTTFSMPALFLILASIPCWFFYINVYERRDMLYEKWLEREKF